MTPTSFRSTQSEKTYQQAKLDNKLRPLSEIPSLIDYEYWRVVANDYPGDNTFSTHDMIVPRRVFATEDEMSLAEFTELRAIKHELRNQYQVFYENTLQNRSILNHYHIHAVRIKKRED